MGYAFLKIFATKMTGSSSFGRVSLPCVPGGQWKVALVGEGLDGGLSAVAMRTMTFDRIVLARCQQFADFRCFPAWRFRLPPCLVPEFAIYSLLLQAEQCSVDPVHDCIELFTGIG
jgi:hypothetical protein